MKKNNKNCLTQYVSMLVGILLAVVVVVVHTKDEVLPPSPTQYSLAQLVVGADNVVYNWVDRNNTRYRYDVVNHRTGTASSLYYVKTVSEERAFVVYKDDRGQPACFYVPAKTMLLTMYDPLKDHTTNYKYGGVAQSSKGIQSNYWYTSPEPNDALIFYAALSDNSPVELYDNDDPDDPSLEIVYAQYKVGLGSFDNSTFLLPKFTNNGRNCSPPPSPPGKLNTIELKL